MPPPLRFCNRNCNHFCRGWHAICSRKAMKHKTQIKIMDKDVLNGIIAKYDALREETIVENEYFDDAEGKFVRLNDVVDDYPGVTLKDYDVFEPDHPNKLICRTLCRYLAQELDIYLVWNEDLQNSFLCLLNRVYAQTERVKADKSAFFKRSVTPNTIPTTKVPKNVSDCLFHPIIVDSIVAMLLQLDTSVNLSSSYVSQLETYCCKQMLKQTEKPFYLILKEECQKLYADRLNRLDSKITLVFNDGHHSDYVREQVRTAIEKCTDFVHYAFLEIVLYRQGYIKNHNKHKAFIAALQAWGLLNTDFTRIFNGTKEKFATLVDIPEKQWSRQDIRKYEEIKSCFVSATSNLKAPTV